MFNFKDMMLLHLLAGAGITLFFAFRDKSKQINRHFYNFGPGILGSQQQWIKWYAWSLGFELITSVLYVHTGMFYFELGMSIIEAVAFTIGAFIVDRIFDILTDGVEVSRLEFKITIPSISNPFKGMGEKIKETTEVHEPDRAQQKQAFDDLTRDN